MVNERRAVAVALCHPLQMWVHALEAVLDPLADVDLVVADTDPERVLDAVARGGVDVVLLGVRPEDGVQPVRAVRERRADVGILVISDHDEGSFIADVVRAGARGYLEQTCGLAELVRAVRGIDRGETWMRPMDVSKLVDGLLSWESSQQEQQDRLAPLSAREREILHCLAAGMRRQTIAEQLFLSPNTVRTHIHHVLRKLEVHSTLAAVSVMRELPEQSAGHHERQLVGGARA